MKISHSTRLKRAWVTRRKNGNATPKNKLPNPPKEEIYDMYWVKNWSQRKIGKHFGVDQIVVRRWLREYQIRSKTLSEAYGGGRPHSGEKHHNWAGDKVSYPALHAWVRKYRGTPRLCEHCGTKTAKKYEWANVSHKYLRDLTDWVRLCTSCHRKFDRQNICLNSEKE